MPIRVNRDVLYERAFSGWRRQFLLEAGGTLYGVGANDYGQLGDGTVFLRRNNLVKVGEGYKDLAAGYYHTLAIKTDGSLWSWGANDYGQLGINSLDDKRRAQPLSLANVVSVAAGARHSLAVQADGSLWAWGGNEYGQLGDGSATYRAVPVWIGKGYLQVAAGPGFTVARKTDGSVWAWGRNASGQLGDGTKTDRNLPVRTLGIATAATVAAGDTYSIAIDASGKLLLWGSSLTATPGTPGVPQLVTSGVRAVSAGDGHLLFTSADGSLFAAGGNGSGQLGIDDPAVYYAAAALPVALGAGVKSFAAAGDHSIAIASDGHAYVFGDNSEGQLATGLDDQLSTPVMLTSDISSFDFNGSVVLALSDEGDLFAWGENSDGRLGDGTTRNRVRPTQIGSGFSQVSSGNLQNFAIKPDYSLWAWGANDFGQLGLGDTTARNRPTKVGDGYKQVSAGGYHTLALQFDGSLWTWGRNQYGQLGNGQFEQRFGPQANPLPIKIGEGFEAILSGVHHNLALKKDGTVWAWGWNDYGQVGDGSTQSRATPVQVASNVAQLMSAQISSVVRDKSGATWVWGYNGESRRRYNVLLVGASQGNVLRPTKIGGSFMGASVGSAHGLYLRNDGLVGAVGYQGFGQLGDGSFGDVRPTVGLVQAGEYTGLLDLLPSVPNALLPDEQPRVLLRSFVAGEASRLSLGVAARIPVVPRANALQRASATASAGYKVFVVAAAQVPPPANVAYFVLQSAAIYPEPTWAVLGFPMVAYLENVAADKEAIVTVDVLANADLSAFPGATLYVGYGLSSDEMIAAGRYRPFYIVPSY